jgi:LCP family protein required for cell wall assembly
MRVNPKYGAIGLLSIPRDTLVNVPGYGPNTRVNTAFNSGNPNLLIQVLKQDFNIEVNHYAEFNFDSFRQVADAIGGVEQYFPAPARDLYSNLVVTHAGCVNLTGDQALAFVRSREYQYYLNGSWHYQQTPESDLARIQRQQSFVRDAVHKAKKVAPTDPVALNGIIGGVTKNLTVDNSFSDSTLLKLAERYRTADLSNVPSWTYPTVNSQEVSGALDTAPGQDAQVVQQWLNVGNPPPPAPKPTTSPPTTTVNPASVSIEVQNGTGNSGQAVTAVGDLQQAGYTASTSSVSGGNRNTGNVIDYAPDSLAAAKQLQSQLKGGASLQEDSSLTPSPYNLRLITGQNYNGLASGNSGTAPPSNAPNAAPAPVSPDSSSFYNGVYVPPGLSPGQVPQTCGE